jgi:hypothetical protein
MVGRRSQDDACANGISISRSSRHGPEVEIREGASEHPGAGRAEGGLNRATSERQTRAMAGTSQASISLPIRLNEAKRRQSPRSLFQRADPEAASKQRQRHQPERLRRRRAGD